MTYNGTLSNSLQDGAKDICFHCGLPLPTGIEYRVCVDEVDHSLCCAGCLAVAQTIIEAGLADYYRNRSAFPAPANTVPDLIADAAAYDLPELQNDFVHRDIDVLEASFFLEGVR